MAKASQPAAEPISKPTGRAVTLSLDMQGIYKLHTALQGLDSYDVPAGDRVVKKFYSLGAMRLDIARNLNVLQGEMEAFEKGRMSLVKECEPKAGGGIKDGDPKWKRFASEFEKMSNQMHELKLVTIDRAKLGLEENPIPVIVLASLESLLVGKLDKDEAEDPPEEE